mmetsp:Transcript_22215/g.21916  ORF Transcript_22215/g.21916 Transcript_22215/m.21916 type:complete len:120 (-) Transcript_22215:13-372(-)
MTLKIILSLALIFIISSAFKHDTLKQEVSTKPMPLFLSQSSTENTEVEATPSTFFSEVYDDWDEDFEWDEDDYLLDNLIDFAIDFIDDKIDDYKENQMEDELEEYEEDQQEEEEGQEEQ